MLKLNVRSELAAAPPVGEQLKGFALRRDRDVKLNPGAVTFASAVLN